MDGRQPPQGTTALVLGILSLCFCALLGPVAWYFGARYESECRALGLQPEGSGTVGKILGMIGTALLLLAIVAIIGLVILAALSDGSSSHRSSRDWFD